MRHKALVRTIRTGFFLAMIATGLGPMPGLAQDLQNGDLLVGVNSAPASIVRLRGSAVDTFCASTTDGYADPGAWNAPNALLADSQGRVVFTADVGTPYGYGFSLMRCNSLGGAVETLGNFPNTLNPKAGVPVPFPGTIFSPGGCPACGYIAQGLHLAKQRAVIIDDSVNGGAPQVTTEDVYTLLAGASGVWHTFRYHTATGTWEQAQDPGTDFPVVISDAINHSGTTFTMYSNNGDVLRRVINPLDLKLSGSALGGNFSIDVSAFAEVAEIQGTILHDVNVPEVDSNCNATDGISNLMPLVNGGFWTMGGFGVAFDEFGDLGLVIAETGGLTPYLTKVSQALLDNPNDHSQFFHDSYYGCAAVASLQMQSILPFYDPTTGRANLIGGANGGGKAMVSTQIGLVGTQSFADDVILIQAGNVVQVLASGLAAQSIAGFPNGVQPPLGVVVVIRVDSSVNVLVTDSNGKRIGVDSLGNAINDYGANGFDNGAGAPRIFAIKNPGASSFTVQTFGTVTGSYTVKLYSTDLTQTSAHLLTTSGTISKGKTTDQVLAVSADQSLTSVLNIPNASLAFPTQLLGTTSLAHTANISNLTTAPLAVASVVPTGDFSEGNNCLPTIKALGSCRISVTFAPTQRGLRTGAVTISDAASAIPQTITLTGTGTVVSLSQTSVNFGTLTVGTTSAPVNITVGNVDPVSPVNISKITLGGLDRSDFQLISNSCGPQIAPSSSCTLTVTFTPKATGTRTATITIADDGGGSSQSVKLTGSGM